ncbi:MULTISPECIES: antitoxin Xre/MbcA/ParS toxin-binding domain-containing protein [Pseudomonas]|uniref:antitoxin Xre/MbcA/ParS toxin-binding domain-containing protein n=1 Tax=Pseudomonas TaxID=286 RepID=UPI0004CEB7A1|nr:antitoxin Xre/MbcA/ParS toxin-binding domain-containing protein [Pseudomonas aeruginosa]AIN60110.1 hypothetical protein O165_018095 [Pseudomonas soli]
MKANETALSYKPTDYLSPNIIKQNNSLSVYKAVVEGFALKDVEAMISTSQLYTSARILEKIFGGTKKGCQRALQENVRLSAQKSAVAFQYAKGLELAIKVFGDRQLADQWLGRPCKYLDGIIPLEALENPIGYIAIEAYLENVMYGVYL